MLYSFFQGFTSPHDVHVLADGSAVFVSEIGPNRVWKFNIRKNSKIQSKKISLYLVESRMMFTQE